MNERLRELAPARRGGKPFGITSVCSAHPLVLRSALRRAAQDGGDVLIEATCNQVNHLGGYTGMTPQAFVQLVGSIASEEGLDKSQIIFGGDHLGPNPWRKEDATAAMAKAEAMVAAYIKAGFTKIHLDASMGCAGEPAALDDELIAARAARLAKIAEETAREIGGALPLYVLGTEVPIPGGADHVLDAVEPTSAKAARSTIAIHRDVFIREGLEDAFSRTIAFVVQPGVEFGSENVIAYGPEKARALTVLLDQEPQFVFEAHSTDYQTVGALSSLVRDGFPILKVGPELTFALREALYGLDLIASELSEDYGCRTLATTMEKIMLDDPSDWLGHYHGNKDALRLQQHYSYSDRIRYYWVKAEARAAVNHLEETLRGRSIPKTLLRQFLPRLEERESRTMSMAEIAMGAVDDVLQKYSMACRQN
jgi:D-tagatose-1,6-bisphosphate aldolase subunit GatZ/KbaZ